MTSQNKREEPLGRIVSPNYDPAGQASLFFREASRAICVNKGKMLLMFTEKFDDFSFPGGGLQPNEDPAVGAERELREEAGAQNVRNIQLYGFFEEIRPWLRTQHDFVHMISYYFFCDVDSTLNSPNLEENEVALGMSPHWISIDEAIAHNAQVVREKRQSPYLPREQFMLKSVKNKLQL
ncbi:MAG: NUDIX domain-containing protein [Pseudomonadota bacterium]